MSEVTPGWRLVYIGIEGPIEEMGGLNIWRLNWHDLQVPPIVVSHPSYSAQRHRMWVCEVARPEGRIKFAAGEFSNGIWGVYVPVDQVSGGVA